MKPAKDIRDLFGESRVAVDSQTDERIISDAVKAMDKHRPTTTAHPWADLRKSVLRNGTGKVAAAAAIIIAALLVSYHFTGAVDGTTEVFARIAEAMKNVPWMHGTVNVNLPGTPEQGQTEFWQSFDAGILIEIRPAGEIRLIDSRKREVYVYSPALRQITISRLLDESNVAIGAASPHDILARVVTILSDNDGASMDRRIERQAGEKVEIVRIRVPRGEATEIWAFCVEHKTRLLRTMKTQGYMEDGQFVKVLDGTFDYPAGGPMDIYEAGAPRDAEIVNELPDKLYTPHDLNRPREDAYSVKEHMPKDELAAHYRTYPLEQGQMEIRAGARKDGITLSQLEGLQDYWLMEIGTSVTHLAKSYHSPPAGRIRFDGSFDDIFVQYDVITRGKVSTKEKVQVVLAKLGVQIVESEADCAVWVAEYDGRPLKPLSEVKCPVAGTLGPGTLSAAMIYRIDDLLQYLGKHQDVVVENHTGIEPERYISHVIPNFRTEAGARLAEKWYQDNFGITFRKETRKMPVWTVRRAL